MQADQELSLAAECAGWEDKDSTPYLFFLKFKVALLQNKRKEGWTESSAILYDRHVNYLRTDVGHNPPRT